MTTCSLTRCSPSGMTIINFVGIYWELRRNLPVVLRQAGGKSPYRARVFKDLCVIASAPADNIVPYNRKWTISERAWAERYTEGLIATSLKLPKEMLGYRHV